MARIAGVNIADHKHVVIALPLYMVLENPRHLNCANKLILNRLVKYLSYPIRNWKY